jgi:selenide,water dikinase
LIAGLDSPDDAALWSLNDRQALVVTTDFFTPVVDDPSDYGAIAAANALSDVYAMGGLPLLALNIACLPPDLPLEISQAIFKGGAEKIKESGAVLAGGHSIQDKEPKFGYAVIGLVEKDQIMLKGGAKPGDQLFLTKPLGMGVATTALKQSKAEPDEIAEAILWMKRLNRAARDLAVSIGAQACTDITGFGFLGHLTEMAKASGTGFTIHFEQIPFTSYAYKFAAMWTFAGGAYNNREFFSKYIQVEGPLSEMDQMLLYDPQTSGGLLIAVPAEKKDRFQREALHVGVDTWLVGEIQAGQTFILS